jgi:hypothetical protein
MPVCVLKHGTHTRTEPRARRITHAASDIIAATEAELAEFADKFAHAKAADTRAYLERLVEQEAFTAPPPEPETAGEGEPAESA